MGYLGQFDNLVREQDRGHAIRFTRSIVVLSDGLVVCPVSVSGASPALHRGVVATLMGRGRAIDDSEHLTQLVGIMAAGATAAEFAQAWRGGVAIPFAVVARVILTRPRQVAELAIEEHPAGRAGLARTVFLGDLPADRVRELLGPLLGERLEIDVAPG